MLATRVSILLPAAVFIFLCAATQGSKLHQISSFHPSPPLTTTTITDTTGSFPGISTTTDSSWSSSAQDTITTTTSYNENGVDYDSLPQSKSAPTLARADDHQSPLPFPLSPEATDQGCPWHALLLAMHVLGIALSAVSNGSIVAVIAKTSLLHTPTSVSILALAFSDLLLSLVWHVTGLIQLATHLEEVGDLPHGPLSSPSSSGPTSVSPTSPTPHPERAAAVVGEDIARVLLSSGRGRGGGGGETILHHINATTTLTGTSDDRYGVSHERGMLPVLVESEGACQLVGFLWQSLLATSTLYQAVIACDRYLFIAHPLRYETFITRGRVLVVLVVVSLLAAVLPGTVMISGGSYTYLEPAGTCVSHIMWYTLFIALVFVPSFSVTLASYAGIWSLCVRQLNTPCRARLVREVRQDTHAYNLDEQNGRVAVRRDVGDEFRCCIPALRRTSNASQRTLGDGTFCLQHLVQKSSIMFIEGFFAAVSDDAEHDDEGAGGDGEGGEGDISGEGDGGRTGDMDPLKTVHFVFPENPAMSPSTPPPSCHQPSCPSPSPGVHLHLPDKKTCHLDVVRPTYTLFRTHSDPEASTHNLIATYLATCATAPPSSPLFITTTTPTTSAAPSKHNRRLLRRTTSFHPSPCLPQKSGGSLGHDVPSVSLEAMELSVHRFNGAPKSQSRHPSASNPSSPSLISIRSSPCVAHRFFRSVSSASFLPYNVSTATQPAPSPAQDHHHHTAAPASSAASSAGTATPRHVEGGGDQVRGFVKPIVGWVLTPPDTPDPYRHPAPTSPAPTAITTTTTTTTTTLNNPTTAATTTATATTTAATIASPLSRGTPSAGLRTFGNLLGHALGNTWQENDEDDLLAGQTGSIKGPTAVGDQGVGEEGRGNDASSPREEGGHSAGESGETRPHVLSHTESAFQASCPPKEGERNETSIPNEADEEGGEERGEEGAGGSARGRDQERGRSDAITEVKVPLRRWAKAALLVALPVICIVLTNVPLVAIQTWWVTSGTSSGHFSGAAWVCHVIYVIAPSINSILISLTNRHVRLGLISGLCRRHYPN